jgi:hypothetical protein
MRRRGLWTALGLLLLPAMPAVMKLYWVQEILFVLLGLALTFIALMPVLVAFLLLQGGLRRALPWLKRGMARLAAWSHMQPWANRLRARF